MRNLKNFYDAHTQILILNPPLAKGARGDLEAVMQKTQRQGCHVNVALLFLFCNSH
jgi:hypothetical protein